MAGVRHHTHPRFLLKGFATRVEGAKAFAWVYWRGREPREWSLRDIAVGKHFYGREGELNADPAITDQEAELAVLVDDLRIRPDGTEIVNPAVTSLVAHLSVRTKHLRDSILESSESLLPHIERYLLDLRNIQPLVLEHLTRSDAFWGQNRSRKRFAERQAPKAMRQHRAQLRTARAAFMAHVKSVLPAAIRNGHIKALASTPVPEPRVEHYRSLRWFVRHSPVPLILGDVGCLFEVSGPERYRSLPGKDDRVEVVSLPLSSDRMLVGASAAPELDFEALTEVHAKYSRDFFVCSQRCARMDSLALKLGQEPGLITDEEMSRVLHELLSQRSTS